MRTVFKNNSEVCHIYATQSQDSGKSGNIFFNNKDIYSYGMHYLAGRIYENKKQKAIIINSNKYSVSTSKHLSEISSATSHMIQVYGNPRDPRASLDRMHAELGDRYFDWFTRRSIRWDFDVEFIRDIWSRFKEDIQNFNSACDFFKYPSLKISLTDDHKKLLFEKFSQLKAKYKFDQSPEQLAKRSADQVKRVEAKAKKEAEKKQLEERDRAQQLEVWKSGGPLGSKIKYIRPQLIRINNDVVETTGGASAPLNEALDFYRLLKNGKAKEGDKVGQFELRDISRGQISIGCHTFNLSDVDQVLGKVRPALRLVGAK